jgi:hypothetical protein
MRIVAATIAVALALTLGASAQDRFPAKAGAKKAAPAATIVPPGGVVPPTSPPARPPVSAQAASTNPVALLQKFTVDDLTAALADALAQSPPDTTAADCYTALIPIVQSGVSNPLPTGVGAFQLFQKGRDLKSLIANMQSPNGPLVALNKACAPLVIDTQNTLIQLGVIGGVVLANPLHLPIPLP